MGCERCGFDTGIRFPLLTGSGTAFMVPGVHTVGIAGANPVSAVWPLPSGRLMEVPCGSAPVRSDRLNTMNIMTKWMGHPKDSAAQLFLPSLIMGAAMAALGALLHGATGENPVGPVVSSLSGSWEAASPLALFMVTVWGFHLVSYLLVGSFAKDLSVVARAARRLGCASWRKLFAAWAAAVPAPVHDITPSLLLVRLFRRGLSAWLATGGGPGIWCNWKSIQSPFRST